MTGEYKKNNLFRVMPKVTVSKQSSKDAQSAFLEVKNLLQDDQELKKLDPSYACTFNDAALSGTANGKLFKANMTVKSQGTGCHVEIVVDLPLALALAKGLVEKTLQRKLNESLS